MESTGTGEFPDSQAVSTGNIPILTGRKFGKYPGMTNRPRKTSRKSPTAPIPSRHGASREEVLARLDRRIHVLGISRNKALQEAGLKEDRIRDLIRGKKAPPVDLVAALAPVLGVTPQWLAFEVGAEGAQSGDHDSSGGIPIYGEVAAGLWLEVDALRREHPPALPLSPDPRWPAGAQYALAVRGTSINRIAQDADILICLDLNRASVEAENGELVIVERSRAQGGEKEVTAKRLRKRPGGIIELHPDSDDPRWQEPIILDNAKNRDRNDEAKVVAIVIGVYRAVSRRGEPFRV